MDNTSYVNDEVFRSEIRRIEQRQDNMESRFEQRLENAVERIELKMDAYTARTEAVVAQINGRVDKIETKVDMLIHVFGWTIGLLTLVVTISGIIIPLMTR